MSPHDATVVTDCSGRFGAFLISPTVSGRSMSYATATGSCALQAQPVDPCASRGLASALLAGAAHIARTLPFVTLLLLLLIGNILAVAAIVITDGIIRIWNVVISRAATLRRYSRYDMVLAPMDRHGNQQGLRARA